MLKNFCFAEIVIIKSVYSNSAALNESWFSNLARNRKSLATPASIALYLDHITFKNISFDLIDQLFLAPMSYHGEIHLLHLE